MSMSSENNNESVKYKNYQFTMKLENQSFVRGGKYLMSVATDYLLTQISEHAQMPEK